MAANFSDYDTDDGRWRAVETRDPKADGHFFSCVRTTGIYCRPRCPGRPHRKNVFFVSSPAEARAAGLRACKRCRPDEARRAAP
jgi:AraC family transcriptional regulator of adaptative response/methylated-DNA-[protein]-cysteine methyltransferase